MSEARWHVVLDLDDTLYEEAEYVASALRFAGTVVAEAFGGDDAGPRLLALRAEGVKDPLAALWAERALPRSALAEVVAAMRGHRPSLALPDDSAALVAALDARGISWSILTDGRSLTQRQKIAALGLRGAHAVFVSEERGVAKPSLQAFTQVVDAAGPAHLFAYVADNPAKDFVAPNALGWRTVMRRGRGRNVHAQPSELPAAYRAAFEVDDLRDVLPLLEETR